VSESLRGAGLAARVMVDCSHGNSSKDYRRQPVVAHALAEQIAAGEAAIFGIMMESFLVDGRQDLKPGVELRYGQSITDACLGWDATVPVLHELAEAVRTRRAARGSKSAAI
jgi:3-deoxy-7-phosphoheptulonate synthase